MSVRVVVLGHCLPNLSEIVIEALKLLMKYVNKHEIKLHGFTGILFLKKYCVLGISVASLNGVSLTCKIWAFGKRSKNEH